VPMYFEFILITKICLLVFLEFIFFLTFDYERGHCNNGRWVFICHVDYAIM